MFQIEQHHYQQMLNDVQGRAPLEACGLLAGKAGRSTAVFVIENLLHSPVAFRMQPEQQLRAMYTIDTRGWQLLAIYHSHPTGPSQPSATDLKAQTDPEPYQLIFSPDSHQAWICKAFKLLENKFAQVEFSIL